MSKNEQPEKRGAFAPSELRAARADGQPDRLMGYAAVFDAMSDDLGGWRERIAKGAFARSITEGADVRALIDHDTAQVIGRTKSGTLRLAETNVGLSVEIDLPATTAARDLSTLIERGDVSQMSFGFYTREDRWDKVDGAWVRTLLDAELFDVSVVAIPAYPQTEVALRGFTSARNAAIGPPTEPIRLLRPREAAIRAAAAEC